MEETKSQILSDRNIASILLLSMAIQYIPIDGWGTSYVKTAISVLSFYFILSRSRYMSKAIFLTIIYTAAMCTVYFLQFSGGWLTILHNFLYWLSFCLFFNLVYHNRVYDGESFIGLMKFLIYLLTIVLVVQQFLHLIGIDYFPLANMYGMEYYSFFRLPSLTIEPSHTARVLVVCLYSLLKVAEYQNGRPLTIMELFAQYRSPLLCALYTAFCIGSGTCVVGLAIVALYFLRRQYAIAVVLVVFLFYLFYPIIDYAPLTRVMNVFNATLTNDFDVVRRVDNSASVRVSFLFGLMNNLDFTESKVWFGTGTTTFQTLATIDMYGFVVYLFMLLLVGSCCISDLQSLLFFVLLLGLDVRNFAYTFSILMMLSAVKFFKTNELNDY